MLRRTTFFNAMNRQFNQTVGRSRITLKIFSAMSMTLGAHYHFTVNGNQKILLVAVQT